MNPVPPPDITTSLTSESLDTDLTSYIVTIIIVNYNVKDFLFHCLESISTVRRTFAVRVIVVDNNSDDSSVEYLQPLFPWVEFISLKENIGFGRANNIGIKLSTSTYTLLLNPDTVIRADTLLVMTDYMKSNPDVGIAGCKVLNADGSFQAACRRGFPTPWASFCKLFGLQTLFPHSPIFAQYNQTFRPDDQTYTVDAVIGAFMFCSTRELQEINGFDSDFFMYGEDLDLCYRMKQHGYSTKYVHTTSIIHYKGESTRRSSMNELKVFYEAMGIFARKHYGTSSIFLFFLDSGIWVRLHLAYILRYKRGVMMLIADLAFANVTLMIMTFWRFGDYFGFPEYAYPTVFFALSVVILISMISVGEYFENKPSIRRALSGYFISFFLLSSLTYYWKSFAFSRGVLLLTVMGGILGAIVLRLLTEIADRVFGGRADRRIALMGITNATPTLIQTLSSSGRMLNTTIVGIITTKETSIGAVENIPVIGNLSYLSKTLEKNAIDEVIILDDNISHSDMINIVQSTASFGVKYHFGNEIESVVISKIIQDISGVTTGLPQYAIMRLRTRILRRCIDIVVSSVLLSIGLPFVILVRLTFKEYLRMWFDVLRGRMSVIGTYPVIGKTYQVPTGVTSLVYISSPKSLSLDAINKLNEYYIEQYNVSLDIDIILKSILRRHKRKQTLEF